MGHHGSNDEYAGRVPPLHCSEDRGEYSTAIRGRGLGVLPVEEDLEAFGLWPMHYYVRR